MPKQTKRKGLEALAAAEITEIAQEGDKNEELEQHRNKLNEFLDPFYQRAEEALADVEAALSERDDMVSCVRMVNVTLSDMEGDPESRYNKLIEQQKAFERQANAKSRKVNGVNIPRVPDVAPERQKLQAVSTEIGVIRKNVADFWAGVYKVDADEAFEKVRQENKAWQKQKN